MKAFLSSNKCWSFCLCLVTFLLVPDTANGISLEPDGGYQISIGVADNVPGRITEPHEYIENPKNMIQEFATGLWLSTDKIFYIKSADILIPQSWAEKLGAVDAITVSFSTVDILVSNDTLVPRTENYYPCGKAGVRVHLPIEFITDVTFQGGKYGPSGKGLLNLWLRYRFGVWEEHGYPNHTVTPYMYQMNSTGFSPWKLNSCNNSELHGEFTRLTNFKPIDQLITNETCGIDGRIEMDTSCRFVPYEGAVSNTANTSMMNFHWLQSIVKLCDENNHDKYAPNRQNVYCDHRSIWEVIKSSLDYKKLNESRIQDDMHVPEIEFNIVKDSTKPLFYILLDTGTPSILVNHTMYKVWLAELTSMIKMIDSSVVGKFVTYPKYFQDTDLFEQVSWRNLDSDGKDAFIRALDIRNESDAFIYDLRKALAESIEELKVRNHPHGAVLLVLRIEGSFIGGPLTLYEEDYNIDLKMYGIKLFEVDVFRVDKNPEYLRLEYLASQSGGFGVRFELEDNDHGDGSSSSSTHLEAQNNLTKIANAVLSELDSKIIRSNEYKLIYRQVIKPTPKNQLLIPKRDDIEQLHIYVTTKYEIDYIRFQLPATYEPFKKRTQWGAGERLTARNFGYTYSLTVNVSALEEEDYGENVWAWELYILILMETYSPYGGVILVYGSNSWDNPTPRLVSRNVVNTEIFTSADWNKNFECLTNEINEEPLSIYVKLSGENGNPIVINIDHRSYYQSEEDEDSKYGPEFRVHLVSLQREEVLTAVLNDGGFGPDLIAEDGVYSAYIYPSGGPYRIFATFYDDKEAFEETIIKRSYPFGTLLSKQQDELELSTIGSTLNTQFSFYASSSSHIYTAANCRDKRFISRIRDVRAEVTADDIVKILFTVPLLVTAPKTETSEFYEDQRAEEDFGYFMGMIRMVADIQSLWEDPEQIPQAVFLSEISPPGRTYLYYTNRDNSTFLSLEMLDFRQPPTKSAGSNIASIKGWLILPPGDKDPPTILTGCGLACIVWVSLGCGVIMLILLSISIILCRKIRRQRKQILLLTRNEVREFRFGVQPPPRPTTEEPATTGATVENDYPLSSDFIQSLPYDSKYEIPNNRLHIDRTDLLGSGTFGNVFKGYVVNMPGTSGKVLVVAVKTMKPNVDKVYFKALLTEVKLMTHIGSTHPNIVRLVGACTKNIRKCEVFMAVEFCTNGNLLNYLQKLNGHRFKDLIDENGHLQMQKAILAEDEISTTNLLKWAREIANGMEYLGQKRIIHGDLAARNILLDHNIVAKISDFGLSKQLLQYSKYAVENAGGLLPWKWLAPETLQFMKFSVGSDIWAYGVTIWEIFSLGQNPYPGINWSPDFVSKLEKNGLRLLKPNFATHTIYQIMLDCWRLNPSHRPSFYQLKSAFDHMMVIASPAEYMDLVNTVEYTSVMNGDQYSTV